MDQFSEFVRGFNPSLDESLTLVGAKPFQLDQRRAQLATPEQAIRNDADKQTQFPMQEPNIAISSAPQKLLLPVPFAP